MISSASFPDFDRLDGRCASLLGMTPAEVDQCSFRDLNAMMRGVMLHQRDQNEDNWRRTLTLSQAIINTVSRKPKRLDAMWPKRAQKNTETMPIEEYRAWRDDVVRKIKRK